jgi:hypothetical protein
MVVRLDHDAAARDAGIEAVEPFDVLPYSSLYGFGGWNPTERKL